MATTTRLSLDEFLALPGIDERRLELIDGEVCEKVSPRWGHGNLALKLGALLDQHGAASVEPRAIIPRGANLDDSAPIPDIAFYRDNPPEPDDWMRRPPHVAVEVVSPGQNRRELRVKVDLYLQFGVESVWVFDLERESVDVYEGGARRTLAGDDVFESPAVPGFSMIVGPLFDAVLRRPQS
jgi:Uma2 family endonuclease